jgi:hypothetical protein
MKNLLTVVAIIFSFYVIFGELKRFDFNYQDQSSETEFVEENVDIIIRGLNDFDSLDLITVKNTIEKTYGLNCKISDPVQVECENSTIKCEEVDGSNSWSYSDDELITVYVTSLDMYSTENNMMVSGLCFGNSLYLKKSDWLKKVTIHEFTHNYIYDHCENTCVMNTYNEAWDSINDKPIFCDDCKSQLPYELSSKLP